MRRVGAASALGRHLILALAVGCGATAGAEAHMLVVAGLGGEPTYADAFSNQARAAAEHAEQTGATVRLLQGDAAGRDAIRDALADIAAHVDADDVVVLQLIGHGSWDEEHYRFNVPGPDPTADDLGVWLGDLSARQLLILATSASGAALDKLSDKLSANRRTVMAATRDGRQRNAVVFGDYWTKSLASPAADVDKDRRISADEAFDFTVQEVANHYQQDGRIATEHARREGAAANATLAFLGDTAPERELDPALASLVERSDALSQEVERLKSEKATLEEEDYFARLQELLLELAQVERSLEAHREDRAEDE